MRKAAEAGKKTRGRILDWIESRTGDEIRFLTDLCEINSYTFNKEGADMVSGRILSAVEEILPRRRKVEFEDTGDLHILRTGSDGRRGSIYLLGHVDTVFPVDHPFQSCRLEGDRLFGPGTADMKGGLAVFVFALRALHESGALDGFGVSGSSGVPGGPDITLILGPDEEIGSPHSRPVYEEERNRASVCLVGECAGADNHIVVSRNGKTGGRLECRGRDRHVGESGEAGQHKASAVLELAHQIIDIESLNDRLPGVRVNVGRIGGGLSPATVPARAACEFDLRWEKEKQGAVLLEKVRESAARSHIPGCSSTLTFLNRRPSWSLDAGTEVLFFRLLDRGRELGQDFPQSHRFGSSDANFFGAAGVPTLDGFGPVGLEDHTSGEHILLPTLRERTRLLALFLLDLVENPVESSLK